LCDWATGSSPSGATTARTDRSASFSDAFNLKEN
jgi:hypothetical protein